MAKNATRKALAYNFRKYPPVLTVKEVCEMLEFRPTKVYGKRRYSG